MRTSIRWAYGAVSALALTAVILGTATGADTDTTVLKRDGGRGTPARTWQKAAELQKTLSPEEKARLLSRADSAMRGGHRGDRGPGGPMMGKRGHDPLGGILTDDQKSAVGAIRESYRDRFETLHRGMKNGTLTPEQFRLQADALHTQMKAEIDATLTPEQKAKLEQMRQEGGARGGMRGGHHGPRPEAGGSDHAERSADDLNAMATALGLSADQKATVGRIMEQGRSEMKALSEKLRADGTDRATVRTQMQELKNRQRAALDAVLDDTQMEIVRIHDAISHHGKRGGCHGRKGQETPGQGTEQSTPQVPGSTIE